VLSLKANTTLDILYEFSLIWFPNIVTAEKQKIEDTSLLQLEAFNNLEVASYSDNCEGSKCSHHNLYANLDDTTSP